MIGVLASIVAVGMSMAQDQTTDEQRTMRFLHRIGSPDATIRNLEVMQRFVRVQFDDGGRLHFSRSAPSVTFYLNQRDATRATRRSRTEAPRLSFAAAEARAWRLLPEGATRSEWRLKKSRGFEAGTDEQCGNYSFEMDRLYHGLPAAGDSVAVILDAYEGSVLFFREGTGIEPDEPASRVIPVDEARGIAVRALDRIDDARIRDLMKRNWTSQPPTPSQIYARSGGGRGGPFADPDVATWPKKMRLHWVFPERGATWVSMPKRERSCSLG